jgi:hypothetical protein
MIDADSSQLQRKGHHMTLKAQAVEFLEDLRSGGRVNKSYAIALMSEVVKQLSESTPSAVVPPSLDEPKFHPKENTPVRFPAKNWGQYAPCKRCGKHEVPDGDFIVRIKGTGWWHDACFKIINPDFYVGLA